jgi:hypothetical protein
MSARAAIEWRAYAPIGFRLTENEITINTSRAFYLNVAGITLRVNSISYNRNGRFQVSMDSPLMERSLETRLAAALEAKFKTKMDLALQQLSAIRQQRNGRDAKAVIDRVLEIFKGPPRPGLSLANVQMSGNVALNFDFPTAQTLAVSDDYVVDINAQDTLSAQGTFTRRNGQYNVSEIAFRSRQGVRFRAQADPPSTLNSLRVTSLTISDRGIEPVMISGAEEAIMGFRQLLGLISSAQAVASLGAGPNCDPRIDEVQAYLRRQFRGELAPLVRQHRPALLQAGVDPAILRALER